MPDEMVARLDKEKFKNRWWLWIPDLKRVGHPYATDAGIGTAQHATRAKTDEFIGVLWVCFVVLTEKKPQTLLIDMSPGVGG